MKLATGNVKMAINSIRAARWRSWLTMLGIIIGVVSVITIVSIGEGIKSQVNGQINHLGKDLLTIRPGTVNATVSSALTSLNNIVNSSGNATLSSSDLQVVSRRCRLVSFREQFR
jgi:putative ABC transport system permease protein